MAYWGKLLWAHKHPLAGYKVWGYLRGQMHCQPRPLPPVTPNSISSDISSGAISAKIGRILQYYLQGFLQINPTYAKRKVAAISL